MNRRDTALAMLALGVSPLAAQAPARNDGKPYRIALVPALSPQALLQEFTETLREAGRIEGRDFVLIPVPYGVAWDVAVKRAAEDSPDLIVAGNTAVARAFQKLLPTTPVVLLGGGLPVESGIVDSLRRPGRNVTGVTGYADNAIFGKYMQVLRDAKPSIKHVGVIWSQVPPIFLRAEIEHAFAQFREAAQRLKLTVRIMEAAEPQDIDTALAAVGAEGIDALILTVGRAVIVRSKQVMDFSIQKRLPTLTDIRWWWVEPRPLLSYGPPLEAMARQAAGYVDRILWRDAKPGDLPMQQPTRYELTVNLKTAKAIGVTVPQSLLLRADEVIQ